MSIRETEAALFWTAATTLRESRCVATRAEAYTGLVEVALTGSTPAIRERAKALLAQAGVGVRPVPVLSEVGGESVG
jgi:hypothetical protein